MTWLAIDIGGTKLAAGLVDESGALIDSAQVPTPRTHDAEVLWSTLRELCAPFTSTELDSIGVGCGGPMAPGGVHVSPLNIPGWRQFPLRARLADHFALPTFVDNDAKALALAEGWVGAAKGVDNYLAMVVSTGVGGGIVLDGRLLDGSASNAGHIGHIVVEPNGRRCACGSRGCLEAEASGTAIAAITGGHPKDAPNDIIERCATMVGRGVANVAVLLDLELAVVAGSVALGYGDAFFTVAQRTIDELCSIEYARGTVIRPAGLGREGPLVGAAAVARRARNTH